MRIALDGRYPDVMGGRGRGWLLPYGLAICVTGGAASLGILSSAGVVALAAGLGVALLVGELSVARGRAEKAGGQLEGRSPGTRPEELPSLRGVSILVVDDARDARESLAMLLEECGARVTAVASAREALEALACSRPDVLVSDLAMPGLDGYALVARLRALEAGCARPVPALALSAYARTEDRERALAAGFHAHVAKPVEPSEIASAVARLAGAGDLARPRT